MKFELKVKLLSLFFFGIFLLIFVRLFYWQALESPRLSAQADRQHFYTLEIPARRGEIKASDGTVLVADKNTFLLYAQLPKLSSDKGWVAATLSGILAAYVPLVATPGAQITPDDLKKFQQTTKGDLQKYLTDRLNLEGTIWVNLAHFISADQKKAIDDLKIPGIGFEDEQARDYPEASMAAHLLGFVGSDQTGNPAGYFGLEGFYERELAGHPGELRLEKDAFGRPIAIGQETREEKEDGSDLYTTIDRAAQRFVETELAKGISDWQAKGGTAVVMDPNSGAIIALANFPQFDPRSFTYYPTSDYKNPAISNLFEPGSILKPLVMAAAINEDKLTPETRCDRCDGPRQIGNYFIHTFNNEYHPNSTMTDILVNSDNTGMVFVGEKLGFTLLYSYLNKFGLNQNTGVDLEGEAAGTLRKITDYYPIDQATLTFGQGISINALQIVRAFSALANGGHLVTPYVISKVVSNGKTIEIPHPTGQQVISSATAKTITEMLIQVADNSPEHFPKDRISELSKFRIAAKSGTAQIALGGKYSNSGTIASLIGYFPADHPRFVVFVKLNEPEVRPWGSDTAGPVFFAITRDLINYFGISP